MNYAVLKGINKKGQPKIEILAATYRETAKGGILIRFGKWPAEYAPDKIPEQIKFQGRVWDFCGIRAEAEAKSILADAVAIHTELKERIEERKEKIHGKFIKEYGGKILKTRPSKKEEGMIDVLHQFQQSRTAKRTRLFGGYADGGGEYDEYRNYTVTLKKWKTIPIADLPPSLTNPS